MELLILVGFFWVNVAVVITMDILNSFLSLSTEPFRVCLTARLDLLRRIVFVYAWSPLWPTDNLEVLFQVLSWCHGSWLEILWNVVVSVHFFCYIVPKVVTFGVIWWFLHAYFWLLLNVIFHHLILRIKVVCVNYARFCKIRKSFIRCYPPMIRCSWSNRICTCSTL